MTRMSHTKTAEDLTAFLRMQQNSARPRSGSELEAMGKYAANAYVTGRHRTLTEAVVETVKQACLSPEQVRRVVEFTNVNAYLQEFAKEGSPHKVIEFVGGPADPTAILHDLNDGGGGALHDDGHGGGLPLQKESSDVGTLIHREMNVWAKKRLAQGMKGPLKKEIRQSLARSRDYLNRAAEGKSPAEFPQIPRPAVTGGWDAWPNQPGLGQLDVQDRLERGLEKLRLKKAWAERQKVGSADPLYGYGGTHPLDGQLFKGAMEKRASCDDLSDYERPPQASQEKFAELEAEVARHWATSGRELPYADPFRDIMDVHHKVAAACDEVRAQIDTLEAHQYGDEERLVGVVKQAALNGLPLSHVVMAWSGVATDTDRVKLAFEVVAPRLVQDGVFTSLDFVRASLASGHDKLAHVMVNRGHEIVRAFEAFQETVEKLAAYRAARGELMGHLQHIDTFLKHADKTMFQRAEDVWHGTGRATTELGRGLSNAVGGGITGTALHGAAKALPFIAAYKGVQAARESPALVHGYRSVAQYVPGTRANQERKYMREMRRQGMA